MSVRQNRPKTASNMLFFTSEICYCTILINSAGHVVPHWDRSGINLSIYLSVTRYMPAEILNSAHGGNDRYIHFFLADFYDFFLRFLKPFFTTSFYGFGTWPKWLLQPLHFGVFGAAVTRYCRIDRNGTVLCTRMSHSHEWLYVTLPKCDNLMRSHSVMSKLEVREQAHLRIR